MPTTIQQTVRLPARPEVLFDMYLDPEQHAAMTGSPVSISREPGSEFQAFNGLLLGRMLLTVPKRLIVQTWRANHWTSDDLDSILILTFAADPDSGRIDLAHVNVADHDYDDVNRGWETYYWAPWRAYLTQRSAQWSGARRERGPRG